MVIALGEHRIRPIHQCYTIEYKQRDKEGNWNGKWREAGYYPTSLEYGLVRLLELDIKKRSKGCVDVKQLLAEVRAARDEIRALCSV